jgi:LysR family transcriptional activator of nhaA
LAEYIAPAPCLSALVYRRHTRAPLHPCACTRHTGLDMEWLNYHHLLYFWMVAREGSIAKAGEQLRLAQPTISGQIRMLEEQLGEKLFQRSGRNLVMTDVGRLVYEYADQIFALGREMLDTLKDRPTGRPMRFQVGVTDEVAKMLAYRFLQPALTVATATHMVCREGPLDRLLADLATHAVDLVLADTPIAPTIKVKAYSHALGDSPISVCGAPRLVTQYKARFPQSLDGAPMLLPTEQKQLRRSLEQWFEAQGVRPRVVGEFDDTALMNTFGQAGEGLFPVPTAVEPEAVRMYGVGLIGRITEVSERYYAISVERRLKHPAVLAISNAATELLLPPKPRIARRKAAAASIDD